MVPLLRPVEVTVTSSTSKMLVQGGAVVVSNEVQLLRYCT